MSAGSGEGPVLIIVSGQPASGKTTFARALAGALPAPLFAKDGFKEIVFDAFLSEGRTVDRAFSRSLGMACSLLMYEAARAVVASGGVVILESNFPPALARPELSTLASYAGARVVEINVRAPFPVLERRFRARWDSGARHSGHGDGDAAMLAELRSRVEVDPHLVVGIGALVTLENGEAENDSGPGLAAIAETKRLLRGGH